MRSLEEKVDVEQMLVMKREIADLRAELASVKELAKKKVAGRPKKKVEA